MLTEESYYEMFADNINSYVLEAWEPLAKACIIYGKTKKKNRKDARHHVNIALNKVFEDLDFIKFGVYEASLIYEYIDLSDNLGSVALEFQMNLETDYSVYLYYNIFKSRIYLTDFDYGEPSGNRFKDV